MSAIWTISKIPHTLDDQAYLGNEGLRDPIQDTVDDTDRADNGMLSK
jgi:hypothetical protein